MRKVSAKDHPSLVAGLTNGLVYQNGDGSFCGHTTDDEVYNLGPVPDFAESYLVENMAEDGRIKGGAPAPSPPYRRFASAAIAFDEEPSAVNWRNLKRAMLAHQMDYYQDREPDPDELDEVELEYDEKKEAVPMIPAELLGAFIRFNGKLRAITISGTVKELEEFSEARMKVAEILDGMAPNKV